VLSSTAYNIAMGDDFFTVLRGLAERDMKRAVNSSITEFSNGFVCSGCLTLESIALT